MIDEKYNAEMLAASLAKLNGYRYRPGLPVSGKRCRLRAQLYFHHHLLYNDGESLGYCGWLLAQELLLVLSRFDTSLSNRFDNITVKKIPLSVLNGCEYGTGNYNLNIIETVGEPDEDFDDEQ